MLGAAKPRFERRYKWIGTDLHQARRPLALFVNNGGAAGDQPLFGYPVLISFVRYVGAPRLGVSKKWERAYPINAQATHALIVGSIGGGEDGDERTLGQSARPFAG